MLCPEIAVPTKEFAALRVWERQEVRAFAVGLGARKGSSPGKWCFCPFDKTEGLTGSGTGTSPMVRLAHATS